MSNTVLVTGVSSGIGKATAHLFASKGWNVVATLREPEQASELGQIDNVLVARLDVQDAQSIQQAVEAGIARFGSIDVLVNNAGFGQYGLFEALSREDIQRQFDVNVFGVMDVTRALLPHFRKNGHGAVVNISSGAGIFTLPLISLYCATKFALEGFSEALSFELASQNIAVKIVEPHSGVSSTRFTDRSVPSFAADTSLASYDSFVANTNQAFAEMVAARKIDATDVAQVIYDAATDGTDQLRYLIGDDSRGFIKARREMADQDYIDYLRSWFRKTR
jgi:NAD(P)-dependent dehydrogenase (short-subunit alcohol dehydrogenase family)